jgi:aldose 1-epimerase
MSFAIHIEPIADFKLVQIKNLLTQEQIEISTKGGLLNSWKLSPASGFFDIIDGNNFEEGWKNFESNGFKGGKMNPFSCRLKNGTYIHEGKQYTIDKFYLGDHALHGILYDANFEIIHTEANENDASVTLNYEYQKNDKGFPFHYTISLKWIFEKNNKVQVETTITNKDQHSFPMMDGWHPYFKLDENINDCTLQFINKGKLVYNTDLLPTGEVLPCHDFETPKSLDAIELDNGYVLDSEQPSATFENKNFKLVVTPDSNYSYLQLYIPNNRKSIAIENLTAAPDSFNNKMGLHIMQPQEIWSLKTQYQLFYK